MKNFLGNWNRDRVPYRAGLAGLALFYLALVLLFSPDQLKHDEPRYFQGAHNLTRGFFVPEGHPDFTNGPGYPLLLAPVTALLGFDFDQLEQDSQDYEFYIPDGHGGRLEHLKGRLLPLRLLNVFFLSAGLFVTWQLARQFVSNRAAFLLMIAVGLNPFQLRWVPCMMTENVTPLLFGTFALCWVRALRAKRFPIGWIILAAVSFAWLAMVRTLFGYVATAGLVFVPILCLISGRWKMAGRAVSPLAAALVLCLPYLSYTRHLTGQLFCWATNGPELLYWITSPREGEYGSWLQEKWVVRDSMLSERHLDFVQRVNDLPVEERPAAWMEGFRRNLEIEGAAKALARNYLANVSRLFFNVPRTREFEDFPKLVWTLTGYTVLLAACFAAGVTLWRWRAVPLELKALLLLGVIYSGGLLILPAEPRYLIPLAPLIAAWIGFAATRLVRIRLEVVREDSHAGAAAAAG